MASVEVSLITLIVIGQLLREYTSPHLFSSFLRSSRISISSYKYCMVPSMQGLAVSCI